MNCLRTLSLTTISLLSLNAYAQETYTYRQEFESFRQSAEFTEQLEAFVDILASVSPETVDATQRSTVLASFIDIDFAFSCSESLPLLDAALERMCVASEIEKPLTIIINRTVPWGDTIACQFECEGTALIIAKEFLLQATDEELEAFILEKLIELQQLAAEVAANDTQEESSQETKNTVN